MTAANDGLLMTRFRLPLIMLLLGAGAVALAALLLEPSAKTSTLAGGGSRTAAATHTLHQRFGEEPILVLVRAKRGEGRLPSLLLTADLGRMLGLEGCLSGNRPRRAKSPAPVCNEFARTKPIQAVYGPGTFINESARQIAARFADQRAATEREANRVARAARKVAAAQGKTPDEQESLANRARELVYAQGSQDTLSLALRYGLPRVPQLNDPDFVLKLVFEPSLGFATPKPRFSYVFPSADTALIQARLRPGLSRSQRENAIALVRKAVASRPFRLERGTYLVSGSPVVAEGVAESLPDAMPVPIVAALVLVGGVLLVALRRAAVVPLFAIALGIALAYALLAVLGGSLTLASLALAPIAGGLAAALVLVGRALRVRDRARSLALPLAVLSLGLLALLLSPVPMVRSLGLFGAIGLLFSILFWERLFPQPKERPPEEGGRRRRFGQRGWSRFIAVSARRPGWVLVLALVVAIGGLVAGPRADVKNGNERLAAQDVKEVEDAKTVRRATGSAGDATVVVESERLISPPVLRWMASYQSRVLGRHGYSDERLCGQAELCPALSLTSLLGPARTPAQVRRVVRRLPPYFARSVLSPDRRTATMSFAVKDSSPERQKELFDDLRRQLDPPAGVRAELGGEPVLLANVSADLETNWIAIACAALAALVLALFATRRRGAEATIPLVPVALAAAWSGLVLYALPIPINPLSGAVSAFVVGLGGAFALLLAGEYRGRRRSGEEATVALERSYAELAGLLPAALAALAGFAALLASDVAMLRDTGIAATLDLALVLAGIVVVLPAALVWSEALRPIRLPTTREALAKARKLGGAGRSRVVPAGRRLGALGRAVGRGAARALRRPRGIRRGPSPPSRRRRRRPDEGPRGARPPVEP